MRRAGKILRRSRENVEPARRVSGEIPFGPCGMWHGRQFELEEWERYDRERVVGRDFC